MKLLFLLYAGNALGVKASSNWSGAQVQGKNITHVTGTIIVPDVSGQPGKHASAWVGIDGARGTGLFQTGLGFHGDGSIRSFYEWLPRHARFFNNFHVLPGDEVRMSIDLTSSTSGTASLENLSSGNIISETFATGNSNLHEATAEWIVEDQSAGGKLVPFANFGSITFTDAVAKTADGRVLTPASGDLLEIEQGEKRLTSCGLDGSELTCHYVGP